VQVQKVTAGRTIIFSTLRSKKMKGQRILSKHRAVSNPSAGINRTRFDGFTLSLFKLAAQVLIGRRAVLAMLTYCCTLRWLCAGLHPLNTCSRRLKIELILH
jgi:hypothetical protein